MLIRSAVVGQWCVEVTILEQWSKTINLEVTLIEDYKCQILEEINYEKDHMKKIMIQLILLMKQEWTNSRQEGVDVAMSWGKMELI